MERLSLEDALSLAASGEIMDAKTIVGLMMAVNQPDVTSMLRCTK